MYAKSHGKTNKALSKYYSILGGRAGGGGRGVGMSGVVCFNYHVLVFCFIGLKTGTLVLHAYIKSINKEGEVLRLDACIADLHPI
jgi:hypothetical protein